MADAFAQNFKFSHRKSDFHFAPASAATASDVILGRVGRTFTTNENAPPEQGFMDTTHEGWKACVVVIDPTEHDDGQKVAVQVDLRVGAPMAILRSLTQHINANSAGQPYHIEVEPIFNASDFWEFAKANEGSVTSVTFEFIAPNGPWNTTESIHEEMREWRKAAGAQKVITTIQSDDGLNTDAEQIKEGVDYVTKGSGKLTARARGRRRFSSTTRPSTAILADDGPESEESILVRVARRISEVLGR